MKEDVRPKASDDAMAPGPADKQENAKAKAARKQANAKAEAAGKKANAKAEAAGKTKAKAKAKSKAKAVESPDNVVHEAAATKAPKKAHV